MSTEREPTYRSFRLISDDHPDISRLGILVELFLEMDAGETRRALEYLHDKFVTNRKIIED